MTHVLEVSVVEEMVSETFQRWVLIPAPIASLKKKRKEFEKAVRDGKWSLVHDRWEDALEAARELSDRGGIDTVTIARVKHDVNLHAVFKDGKQVKETR